MDFRDFLKQRCRQRGLSLHRLAQLCEVNPIYFYQFVNKNKSNPPPWVLRRAAGPLGLTYIELLVAAGYIDEQDLNDWARRAAPELVGAAAR